MSLLDMLRKLGDRLGIVELSPGQEQPAVPVKIHTRTITLSELIMTIQIAEVRELAELPAELSISFDDIFKAAGIQPSPSAWTVDRLQEFLNSKRIQGMDRDGVQRETLRMLAAEKVDAADLIKDAISRDQALDAFADSILKKRELWLARKRQEIQALEQEIAVEEKEFSDWRRRKRRREQDMARAIGYLIDRPVISIDDE
jgi:predicted amino acid-binding ACT domain protein